MKWNYNDISGTNFFSHHTKLFRSKRTTDNNIFFPSYFSQKKKILSKQFNCHNSTFFFFSPFLHFGNETVIIKLFFSFSLYFGNDIPTIQFYFSLSSLPLFGNDIIIIQLFFLSPYFGQINFGQVSLTAQKLGRYFSKILPKSLFLSIPVRHTISLSSLLHFLTISIYHCWNSPLFSLHISQINLNLHNI